MIFEEEFQITGRLDWNFRSLWEKLSGKSADYGGGSPQWGHLFFFFAHFFIMAISVNLTTFIILNILTIPTISKSSSSLPSSRFALSSPFSPFSPSKSSFGARSYHPHLHYTLPPLEQGEKTDYNDDAYHGLIISLLFRNNNCHV